jgi:hypothetical protein
MTHKYYHEDTEQRKSYFDKQFLSNAKFLASMQGIPLQQILSQITDLESFRKVLEQVWSQDSSLLAYLEGMGDEELQEFFDRKVIQNIIKEKILSEEKIPDQVMQVNKKTRSLFLGEVKSKKTGKISKVFVKQWVVFIKGKRIGVFRDSKGRFSKKLR